MGTEHREEGTLTNVERLRNSVNGGPRYEFTIEPRDGVLVRWRSGADTQFVHELPNTEFMIGKRVTLTIRNMQWVIDLKVLDT